MADTYNAAARTQKNAETGLVWVEKLTNASGSIEVPKYAAIRVRAASTLTVTIGGTLAASMASGEIMVLNTGIGDPTDEKKTVTVDISGNSYTQVGKTVEPRSAKS